MPDPLLLFDASADGHHPEYVRHVVDGLAVRGHAARTVVAVPPAMLKAHPDLAASGVQTFPVDAEPPTGGPWAIAQQTWPHLAEAVRRVRPARVLLLYADAVVPSLARGSRLAGDPGLWTIHFRPPVPEPGRRLRERLRDLVKQRQLRAVLRRPDLRAAFTLDPRALNAFRALARSASAAALADPVMPTAWTPAEQAEARDRVRGELGVEPGRHLMVLFGSLAPRKGIFQTVEALRHLPAEVAARLAVALIGPIDADCREAFAAAVAAHDSPARLITRDRSITETGIAPLLVAADTVLLPYQRHIGSSAVLIRAAGLARPAITQEAGLVGEWTRGHGLGRAVDSTSPDALARAITAAVLDPAGPFDPGAARAFAAGHTPDAFVRTLLDGPAGLLA